MQIRISPVRAPWTRLFLGFALLLLNAMAAIACQTMEPQVSSDVTPSELASPSPTPESHSMTAPIAWKATPILEERILTSDFIVQAKLLTAEAKTRTVPGEEGVEPTYVPVVEFVFQVDEYLKGDGPSQITVDDYAEHNFESIEEAVFSAESRLRFRNSAWDDREAVIFLKVPNYHETLSYDAKGIYNFASPIPKIHGGYHLDSINKVWLPAKDGDSQGEGPYLADSEPDGVTGELPTIALDALRRQIAEADALLRNGEGIEGYEYCIHQKFNKDRHRRAVEEVTGKSLGSDPSSYYFNITSGAASGTVLSEGWVGANLGVPRHWLEGYDAELFEVLTLDENGDVLHPSDIRDVDGSYDISYRTVRLLPAGRYKYYNRVHLPVWKPCNYMPALEEAPLIGINVTAPADVKLEAFFDPATTGEQTLGAGDHNGLLKAGSFYSAESSEFAISRIDWSSGNVEMQLTPHSLLPDHHIDFVALDSSVSLRLDFDDAAVVTETDGSQALGWGVCEQPWEDGDKLMIRISESGDNLTGTTNDAECAATTTAP